MTTRSNSARAGHFTRPAVQTFAIRAIRRVRRRESRQ
jgi:hypothetical protein